MQHRCLTMLQVTVAFRRQAFGQPTMQEQGAAESLATYPHICCMSPCHSWKMRQSLCTFGTASVSESPPMITMCLSMRCNAWQQYAFRDVRQGVAKLECLRYPAANKSKPQLGLRGVSFTSPLYHNKPQPSPVHIPTKQIVSASCPYHSGASSPPVFFTVVSPCVCVYACVFVRVEGAVMMTVVCH